MVEECVGWMLGERSVSAWSAMLWRELRRRRLAYQPHRPACVCQDCIEDWREGVHPDDAEPF